MIMVDIFTLIQILEDLRQLFDQLQVSSKIIELSISISPKAKTIIKNIEKVKEENTASLYLIQKEIKTVVQNSIKSIQRDELLKNNNGFESYKKLLSFVKKNYSLLKQFQIDDTFFEEIILII